MVLGFQRAALPPLCWSWADPMTQDTWLLIMLSLCLICFHAKWPWALLTFLLKSCFPDLQLFLQVFSSWSTFLGVEIKKKKTKNKSHSELTSVPWLWPHKCWESWGLVPAPISIRKCWFPPQQNLFHAGDSSQILFITSFPPASIHTANSSCLCINSCFAFTELHPPSLSFFFSEHFSNLFDLLKWKRLHWAASTNTWCSLNSPVLKISAWL